MAEVNIDVAKESTGQQILSATAKETTSQEILSKLDSGGTEKNCFPSCSVYPLTLINEEISEVTQPGYRSYYFIAEFTPDVSGLVNVNVRAKLTYGNGTWTTGTLYAVPIDGKAGGETAAYGKGDEYFKIDGDSAVGTLFTFPQTISTKVTTLTLTTVGSTSGDYVESNAAIGVTKGVPVRFFLYFYNSAQYVRFYIDTLRIGYVLR